MIHYVCIMLGIVCVVGHIRHRRWCCHGGLLGSILTNPSMSVNILAANHMKMVVEITSETLYYITIALLKKLCALSPRSQLNRPNNRRLSAKLELTFAGRCYVVRMTDSYGRILGFLNWISLHTLINIELNTGVIYHVYSKHGCQLEHYIRDFLYGRTVVILLAW
jgi:hypothetical protein